MVHGVECVDEVKIHYPYGLLLVGGLLKSPVPGLHLTLCGVQPAEPLLQRVPTGCAVPIPSSGVLTTWLISIYEYILRYTLLLQSYTILQYNTICNSRNRISQYISIYLDIYFWQKVYHRMSV